jgi:hypothetical protein
MAIRPDSRGSKGWGSATPREFEQSSTSSVSFHSPTGSVLPPADKEPGEWKTKRSWLLRRGKREYSFAPITRSIQHRVCPKGADLRNITEK